MNSWFAYNEGITIGAKGPEGDVILMDEAHPIGARVTIKEGAQYVSVSCNIYNWINHTRFFSTVTEAKREFEIMKDALLQIIDLLAAKEINKIKVWEEISNFVRRFP